MVFAAPTFGQIDDQENIALETWLASRKLDSLLLEQLESRLESTTNATSRKEIAGRLAMLYGEKLLSVDEDSQPMLKRTRELISLYPGFETGQLRVAMLHARYLDSEKGFLDGIREGAGFEAQEDLESDLETLYGDLSNALSALMRQSEELQAASQLNRDRRPLEAQRQLVEAEAIHCQFLAGWSSYFLAMLRENERAELLEQSELRFREFLQLDQRTVLSDYDSRWFDFSSAWHVRAISGLAAVALARGDESQATYLYKLIEANAVTQESREAVIRFRFLAHCYSRQYKEAANAVRDRKAIAAMSQAGKVRLWATVADAAKGTSNSKELRQMALVGLTRETAGERLVREYELGPNEEANSFESCWVAGYVQFWKSDNGEKEAKEKARKLLEAAITFTTTQQPTPDASDVSRCRYLLAWLKLKDNDEESAMGVFAEVAETLAATDPRLASESAWLATKTAIRRGGRDPNRINDAWNMLERFVRSWPDSPHIATASFEKLKIELRSMPPRDAIQRLKVISPADENHGEALLETAVQSYRLWQSRTEDAELLDGLQSACHDVASSQSTSAGQKLRANFLMIDVLLRSGEFDNDELGNLMQRSNSILKQVADRTSATAELLYYRVQIGQRNGDAEAVVNAATELAEIGKGTRFELPALIQIAQHQDSNLTGENSDAIRLQAAIETYERLSNVLGQSEQQLKASANARVAFARLGELQQIAGQSAESERVFLILGEYFPGNAKYLRNLAVARSNSDQAAAKEIWQRLAAGSEAGSELWFESKWQLAKILGKTDRASATKLLQQTMQLGGEVPEQWKQAYESSLQEFRTDEVQ